MKVLHLQPQLNLTCGITRTIYLIMRKLNGEFNQVVFTFGGDAVNKFRKNNLNVILAQKKYSGVINFLFIIIKLFRIIRTNEIQIVHSHHRYFDLAAYLISKFVPIKTTTSVHSKVNDKKLFSYKADILISCSRNIREHLIKNYEIKSDRIKVVYNFVDTDEIKTDKEPYLLKKSLGINDQETVLGFIGRLDIVEKGVDLLLHAFKNLSKHHNDLCLLLIGDGKDKEIIQRQVDEEKLNCKIIGAQENIFDFYNIIDIVILPSRVDPFPLVMLEAGIMRKAFIGSDVDGIKELIEDKKTGVLFKPNNPDSLTDAVRLILSNSELRNKIQNNLFESIQREFTAEKKLPLYKDIYLNL